MSSHNFVLVLTACVDPSTAPRIGVALSDPAIRLHQYESALRYWLRLDDERLKNILVVENSGFCLDRLRLLVETDNPHSKEVEFLQFATNHFPDYLDYGYAELAMIDQAVTTSRLIASTSHFIKTTGRLIFPALPRLLDRLPKDLLFLVDGRQSFCVPRSPYIYSPLMVFSTDFYVDHLLDIKARLTDIAPNMESLLYFKLIGFNALSGAHYRFPINVDPFGRSAYDGGDYRTAKRRAASAIRAIARRLFPRLWV